MVSQLRVPGFPLGEWGDRPLPRLARTSGLLCSGVPGPGGPREDPVPAEHRIELFAVGHHGHDVVVDELLPQGRDLLRSEEYTSELQSRFDIVCRLVLEKKNLPK